MRKLKIAVREFQTDDYIDIWRLNKEEMGYEYPLEATKEKLLQLSKSNSDRIYVALIDSEVVGYIHANDYDVIYAPHMKNIMGIAVTKRWKRKGIGRALMLKAEEWAKETGAKGVRLVSGSSRTNAHSFYHNCGYGEDKIQINLRKMFG